MEPRVKWNICSSGWVAPNPTVASEAVQPEVAARVCSVSESIWRR